MVDTANKRGSAIRTGRAWVLALPAPDAMVSQADRQQVAWSYAGILATGAVIGVYRRPRAIFEAAANRRAVLE